MSTFVIIGHFSQIIGYDSTLITTNNQLDISTYYLTFVD